jgi:signal peptidase I
MAGIVRRHAATFLQLADSLLAGGYAVRFSAEGTSMVPAIHHGDIVVVAPADPATIKAGDIVLYRQLDRPVVHRVTEVRVTATDLPLLMLRGDGKAECDAVGLQQILGKVVSVHGGGRWRSNLRPSQLWQRFQAVRRRFRSRS